MKVPPLSEVAVVGRPNVLTHPRTNAVQQLADVASAIGIASTHLDVRQRTVRRYRIPSEAGRGPTTSISRSEKRGARTGLFLTGGAIVRPAFVRRQMSHREMYSEVSFFR